MTAGLYRVDQFIVPERARAQFLQRVRQTHALLRRQPGFVRDALLEQPHGAGEWRIVTIAEWADEASVQAARQAVQAAHAAEGFSAPQLMARLGIVADMGAFRPLD